MEDKPAEAAKSEIVKEDKSEIMTRDKLGKQGGSGSGSQFPQSGTHPLRSKNPYSFAIWGNIWCEFRKDSLGVYSPWLCGQLQRRLEVSGPVAQHEQNCAARGGAQTGLENRGVETPWLVSIQIYIYIYIPVNCLTSSGIYM